MPSSYCTATQDWIQFSSRAHTIAAESFEESLREVGEFLVKEAQAMAPWEDDTGETRESLHSVVEQLGPQSWRLRVARGEDVESSPYLELMEIGVIRINKWSAPGEVVEVRVMADPGIQVEFQQIMRNFFFERFNSKIGTFKFSGII